ncbi:MAG: LemA family protein [Verrucomicrobiota bacterium]
MHDFAPFLPLIGAVLALASLAGAFRAGQRRRLIDNLPTSKTSGVFIGFVELKGTAESAGPLTSYLAEQSCVHYAWTVEEHWSRTVTTTETDSKGNTRIVTRHESGWTQVAKGGETIPFYLQDDSGVILIQPDGAKIEPAKIFDETCSPGDPLYYAKGPATAVMDSDHRRRFVEMSIPLKAELYIVGQSRERQDIVAPEIAADEHAPMFLISTRSEEQVSRGMKWGARGWTIFGLLAAVGFTVWRDGTLNVDPQSRIAIYATIGAGYFLISLLAWIWMVFNSLVDLRQRVRAAWALVDIQLKRRFDLIPNLVNCVKGYRDHEAQLQTELAALRNQLAATPPGVAGPDHGAVSKVILGIAERYPELKANESFSALQKTLADTEQRIALARSYFNEIATHYNTRLEIVPERYVARLGAMKPQPLMEANDFERAAVTIDFTPK